MTQEKGEAVNGFNTSVAATTIYDILIRPDTAGSAEATQLRLNPKHLAPLNLLFFVSGIAWLSGFRPIVYRRDEHQTPP